MHEISDNIKKNLLDLQYNKYLQYYNTSIIILFTYFIGLAIAIVTNQINYNNGWQLFFVSIISSLVIVLFMLNFKMHLKNITFEIKKLNI